MPFPGYPLPAGKTNSTPRRDNLAPAVNDLAGAVNDLQAQLAAGGGDARVAYLSYITTAQNPDLIISGAITRDSNGAATVAGVVWPDGSPGTYTADTLSGSFPGAVDAYHVTYGSPVTRTYTQPAVTRDVNGAVTDRPALVVS